MILRGLSVENWRNIGKLELADLPAGIVILHGPNKTGKTSLVRALRACLFDADHNTQSAEIKKGLPWSGQGPPRVSVDFEVKETRYRLTKVFSKSKEGMALLEKKVGPSWIVEEDAPKEASRKARELLGADSSDSGVNQLLWLSQGEVKLPEANKVGASLEKQLVEVLGMLLTSRDLAFEAELNDRLGRWYTRTGKDAKSSPIVQIGERTHKLTTDLEEKRAKYRQLEKAIVEVEKLVEQLPEAQRLARLAEQEYQQLQSEQEQCRERMRQYELAEHAHRQAHGEFQGAEKAWKAYEDALVRLSEADKNVAQVEKEEETAHDERDRLGKAHAQAAADLATAQQAEEAHRPGQAEFDDLRKIIPLRRELEELTEKHAKAVRLANECNSLEEKIAHLPNIDEKTLNGLRANRRQATELRARLFAGSLHLEVTAHRQLELQLDLDNSELRPNQVPHGANQTWHFLQRAIIDLPGIARIEVGRGQEDADLERDAKTLDKLDKQYANSLRALGADPTDETSLDRLAENRLQRSAWAEKLKGVRKELGELAPLGSALLEAEKEHPRQQLLLLMERHPTWSDRPLVSSDLERRQAEFNRTLTELETRRKECQSAEKSARDEAKRAEESWQEARESLASARAHAKSSREELERIGPESAIRGRLEQVRMALQEASQRLEQAQLTEAEMTIDQRCQAAETASEERRQRVRDMDKEISHLQGVLRGNEGLHTQLADAEAELNEAERSLAAEKIEARAHRRLRELFDQSRDGQVVRFMGPIAERVLDWAKKLGLDDYQEIRFEDSYMPKGLVLRDGGPDKAIDLEDESYGTSEQLSLLVRLALGGILARDEPAVAVFDDPLTHSDPVKHRRMLDILRLAAEGSSSLQPPAGPLQIIILTCHPERFDYLPGAYQIDLAKVIHRDV